jgi:hypothetical protein
MHRGAHFRTRSWRGRRSRSRAAMLAVIGATTMARVAAADEVSESASEAARAPADRAVEATAQAPARPELTRREEEALEVGELGVGRYLLGGALAIVPSFGAGQAVQGRWSTTGWKVALGEGVSLATTVLSLWQFIPCVTSHSEQTPSDAVCGASQFGVVAGSIALTGFYVWGVGDAWLGGLARMRDHDAAKRKLEAGGARASADAWWVLPNVHAGAPGLVFGRAF